MSDCDDNTTPAEITAGMCIIHNPPLFMGKAAGISHARIESTGHVTLIYEDGTKERGDKPIPIDQPIPTTFALVAHVQGQRKSNI
ncbi:hypothetical protein M0R72_12565 [Candidatus Pacearchaeota archaeon]|jgi:hypothetical protein|nr:hypothetical protein [Candidatus Pacearchaeota archaeon]